MSGRALTYLVHLHRHSRSGPDRTLAGRAGRSGIAPNIGGRHVGYGRVRPRTSGALCSEIDAIDPELLESCVGSNVLGQNGSTRREGKSRFHHASACVMYLGKCVL